MSIYFKKYVLICYIIILTCLFYSKKASGNCQGCCSWHSGVVCRNGVTEYADGTPLSSTCEAKGCDACIEDSESSLIFTNDDSEPSTTLTNDDKTKSGFLY
ncbi:MAG: hypothetical protein ACMUJM_11555 [bacterium]